MDHVETFCQLREDRRGASASEATRTPLFLLEERTIRLLRVPEGYDLDSDCQVVPTGDEDPTALTDDELLELDEVALAIWRPLGVWGTRPEAEDFAERTAHRYRKWRVYAIPADGQLAQALS